MTNTLDELLERIKQRYDPDELVEILEITTEELLEAFYELVEEKRDKFEEIEAEDALAFDPFDDLNESEEWGF